MTRGRMRILERKGKKSETETNKKTDQKKEKKKEKVAALSSLFL
jgi:hypothetical protein